MHKTIIAFLLISGCGLPLQTASAPVISSDQQRELQTEKILQQLELTPEQQALILPIHKNYRERLQRLQTKAALLISTFQQNYPNVDEQLSRQLLNNMFTYRQQHLDIQRNHYNQLKSILSPKEQVLFWQIENKQSKRIKENIESKVPLLKPN